MICSLIEKLALSESSEKLQEKLLWPWSESGRQVLLHSCHLGEGFTEAAGILGGYLARLLN